MDDERVETLKQTLLRAVATEVTPRGARRRALSALRLLALMPPAKAGAREDSVRSIRRQLRPLLKWLLVVLAGACVGALGAALAPRLRPAVAALAKRASALPLLSQNCSEANPGLKGSPQSTSPQLEVTPQVDDQVDAAHAVETRPAGGLPEAAPERSDGSGGVFPAAAPGSVYELSLEIILLDRAHEALRSADPERALTILDDYSALFPDGQLLEEAAIMREQQISASAAAAR